VTLTDTAPLHKGLDNVYVCESKICFIDGENSRLYYRGYSIEELSQKSTFEEVAYLLLNGSLPTTKNLTSFKNELLSASTPSGRLLEWVVENSRNSDPMDILRTSLSMLSVTDKGLESGGPDANLTRGVHILGAAPTIVAAISRARRNLSTVPSPGLSSLAANFLVMHRGEEPDEFDTKAMDQALILHAEHDLNASTFSAIVTASTLSDMYSAVTAAVGTLKGPLHGGANEAAVRFVEHVGTPANAEKEVNDTLDRGQRIMGFGHRVYKNYDPRYKILKATSKELCERKGLATMYATAEAIEKAAVARLSDHKILPNVDFFSGIVFKALGIETELFTPVFTMSRISGWAAHVLEYLSDNRLIRPKSVYTGELDRRYIPVEERGA
jgi:citrate synthase